MLKIESIRQNEHGSVMVVTMLILLLLTIIGVSAIDTTTTEVLIATNEQLHKIAFYAADGGSEAGTVLLEDNVAERDWVDGDEIGSIKVLNGAFYQNGLAEDGNPSDTNRDAFFPSGYMGAETHTNLKFRGAAQLAEGSATQLAAGYEGKGKGAASGGVWLIYEVRAQHVGVRNSRATIHTRWRHVM